MVVTEEASFRRSSEDGEVVGVTGEMTPDIESMAVEYTAPKLIYIIIVIVSLKVAGFFRFNGVSSLKCKVLEASVLFSALRGCYRLFKSTDVAATL